METSDSVVSMLLNGIDATGDDVPGALRQFAQSESGVWTVATSENEVVTYQRTGDVAAENVVVTIDEDGSLAAISLDQRPSGVRSDHPLFYRTTMTFEDLGATVVDVPSDLPVDGPSPPNVTFGHRSVMRRRTGRSPLDHFVLAALQRRDMPPGVADLAVSNVVRSRGGRGVDAFCGTEPSAQYPTRAGRMRP